MQLSILLIGPILYQFSISAVLLVTDISVGYKHSSLTPRSRFPTLSPIFEAKTLLTVMIFTVEIGMSPVSKENSGR